MATEYAFLVTTLTLTPGLADATSAEVSKGLGTALGPFGEQLAKSVPSFQGGGFEIVSHDLTRIDRHLVVTLLLRRYTK